MNLHLKIKTLSFSVEERLFIMMITFCVCTFNNAHCFSQYQRFSDNFSVFVIFFSLTYCLNESVQLQIAFYILFDFGWIVDLMFSSSEQKIHNEQN